MADIFDFTKTTVNKSLLDKIWVFDPRNLEFIEGSELSTYALALSQYLVYFTYQRNLVRAEVHKLTKYIDRTVSLILTINDSYLKKYKTKSAAMDFIITTDTSLLEAQSKIDNLNTELLHTDGIDKTLSDLIGTIKRELTRRENELYAVRMERK